MFLKIARTVSTVVSRVVVCHHHHHHLLLETVAPMRRQVSSVLCIPFVPRPGIVDRYTVRRHTRHWELSWGWQNTRHSNRSAGCSIYVKTKRWRERDLCQVHSTPAVLQGRVGGARLRTGRSDVVMLVAYFPPKPSQQKEWKAYQHTCEAICDWLIETLSLVPTRCSPFVATDLNTQFLY